MANNSNRYLKLLSSILLKCISYFPSSILNYIGGSFCKRNANQIYLYKCVRNGKCQNSIGNLPEERVEINELSMCRFFNIAFLNQALSIILKNKCNGKGVYLNLINRQGVNVWETYFMQPEAEMSKSIFMNKLPITENGLYPKWDSIYNKIERNAWCIIYKKYVKFNEYTQKYISDELENLGILSKRVLGVLCRGTDYMDQKPAGHPVQPSIEELLSEVEARMKDWNMDYIYLATDEIAYEKIFSNHFPNRIITNKRVYYSNAYHKLATDCKGEFVSIGRVAGERENDSYYRGLEYLSSIAILSKCKALIAGNCGGTCAAVFLNDNKYEHCHVFDLGLYS